MIFDSAVIGLINIPTQCSLVSNTRFLLSGMWYVFGVYFTAINVLRMPSKNTSNRLQKGAISGAILVPVLLLAAVIMILAMLRLGIWQLSRADEKQSILDLSKARAASQPLRPTELLETTQPEHWQAELRFQPVEVTGRLLKDRSILIENQVVDKQGGYQLITPFEIEGSDWLIMVSRGWLPAGASRQDLPKFDTPDGRLTLTGRLNTPPAQPPIWNDDYPVNEGAVWQFLPIKTYAKQIQASVLPLVVELAPERVGDSLANDNSLATKGLKVAWQEIDDHWVAKHKAYAFQWFAMALAFFIACLVLLLKKLSKAK